MMSKSGRETLHDVREWSECPPGCPGVIRRAYRMFGSGRESLPDVWKDLPDVRRDLPDVREWLGGPPGCPGLVGRPSRMSGSGRNALPDVRE